jgi:biopolymer transport protein ExbD
MRSAIVAAPLAVFLLAGCQRDPVGSPSASPVRQEKPAVQGSKVIKVKVTASGDITADGQPVTLDQLAAKLANLKTAGGEVWYHRENPAAEPHPNAMKVIELVAENKLPVKLSAKPDFSDAVDDKGVSHPGER